MFVLPFRPTRTATRCLVASFLTVLPVVGSDDPAKEIIVSPDPAPTPAPAPAPAPAPVSSANEIQAFIAQALETESVKTPLRKFRNQVRAYQGLTMTEAPTLQSLLLQATAEESTESSGSAPLQGFALSLATATKDCYTTATLGVMAHLAENDPEWAAGETKALVHHFREEILPLIVDTLNVRMTAIREAEVERFHQLEGKGRLSVCITQ